MSKQIEFSETYLQALKVPLKARGECLSSYVPYHRCMLKTSFWQAATAYPCENEQSLFKKCKKIE